jgi:hypothetical protein
MATVQRLMVQASTIAGNPGIKLYKTQVSFPIKVAVPTSLLNP